ncbi:hypothetical protein [Paracidovorax avenae]|uniref:hypothetical protein n=1 Tax=Paracidovorax avenae TaxID=80867 RepID=UPI00126024CF|nr:hypothetical protein [Paracidovorax avenae]
MNMIDFILEIQTEYFEKPSLKYLDDKLYLDLVDFIEQLENTQADFNKIFVILLDVINGIEKAEANNSLQGAFKEASLEWAYGRKQFLLNYLSEHADEDTLELVHKLLKERGL